MGQRKIRRRYQLQSAKCCVDLCRPSFCKYRNYCSGYKKCHDKSGYWGHFYSIKNYCICSRTCNSSTNQTTNQCVTTRRRKTPNPRYAIPNYFTCQCTNNNMNGNIIRIDDTLSDCCGHCHTKEEWSDKVCNCCKSYCLERF